MAPWAQNWNHSKQGDWIDYENRHCCFDLMINMLNTENKNKNNKTTKNSTEIFCNWRTHIWCGHTHLIRINGWIFLGWSRIAVLLDIILSGFIVTFVLLTCNTFNTNKYLSLLEIRISFTFIRMFQWHWRVYTKLQWMSGRLRLRTAGRGEWMR